VAISAAGIEPETNAASTDAYPQIDRVADYLHDSASPSALPDDAARGVDSPEDCLGWNSARPWHRAGHGRPIRQPRPARTTTRRVRRRPRLSPEEEAAIAAGSSGNGTRLMSLMHERRVYDIGGQNFCLSDCLTIDPQNNDIRTLIFYLRRPAGLRCSTTAP